MKKKIEFEEYKKEVVSIIHEGNTEHIKYLDICINRVQ